MLCVGSRGAALHAGVWFVLQHFWMLDITVGGLTLRTLCKLALAALLPALMVPGLVYAGAPAPALDALVLLQVSAWCAHPLAPHACKCTLCPWDT